jgi:hypothetical protein
MKWKEVSQMPFDLSRMSNMLGAAGAVSGVISGAKGAGQRSIKDTAKRIAYRGIGAGTAGFAAGAGLDYVDKKSKETPAQEFAARARTALHCVQEMQKLAADLEKARMEIIRQSLADKTLQDAMKQPENELAPIQCEVCNYEGQPTNTGLCPECGAVGGVTKAPVESRVVSPYTFNLDLPRDGISVYDADLVGRMQDTW